MRARLAEDQMHPALAFRRFIGPFLFVGGVGLMPVYFTTGFIFASLGLLGCLLEAIYEPYLLFLHPVFQLVTIAVVFIAMAAFIIASFPYSPLGIVVWSDDAIYPEGTVIGGIQWSYKYSQLDVAITVTVQVVEAVFSKGGEGWALRCDRIAAHR